MAMQLKSSSNTVVYEFPSGCELVEESWEKRLDTEMRAYQNGAVLIGDEMVKPRIITVHGIFNATTINTTYGATLLANLKEMKKQCYTQDLRLYPGSQYTDEFYYVECLSFEPTFLGMTEAVEVWIDFQCSDPFRYYKDETTDSETGITSSPHTYTVTNGGDIEVYPVITFTGGASTSLTKLKVANAQDGNKYFEVSTAIGDGDEIEVDCEEGTVKKNGTSTISNFTGSFLKLASGDNSITLTLTGTVGTCQCDFVFRKRWL